MNEKMNMRQKRFAEFYVQSGNIVKSAISAGYSEKYANSDACKILENPSVSQYIRELTEKAKDERIMTAKDRQITLSDIARDDAQKAGDRVKAIDTLNKMTGEYVTKIESSVNMTSPFSELTTEELRKLAEE